MRLTRSGHVAALNSPIVAGNHGLWWQRNGGFCMFGHELMSGSAVFQAHRLTQ
jgi:hypothetical protein